MGKKHRWTIEEAKGIAEERGGECLSDTYNNVYTKLGWRCIDGHEWAAPLRSILRGSWCPKCYHLCRNGDWRRDTIENMHALAKERGGECLSTEYRTNKLKLEWKCSEGHVWSAAPHTIKNGGCWCPECAFDRHRLKIDELREMAENRGGKLLSDEYVDRALHLKWECERGHRWQTSVISVRLGTWCPRCASSKGEEFCRGVFEEIFNVKFPKKRPKWLRNSRGKLMELDGYNKGLGIAFEYNGEQHYREIHYFHSWQGGTFEKRREDDSMKIQLCKENEVNLVVVPYTVTKEDMVDFVILKLKECGIYL